MGQSTPEPGPTRSGTDRAGQSERRSDVSSDFPRRLQRSLSRVWQTRYLRPTLFFVLFFAFVSVLMVLMEARKNGEFADVLDGFWWAIITFSTTGYGDKVPITVGGRVIAVVTIFIGIAAMSLLSGTLASVFVDRNTRARRGLMEYRRVKNHLVICGWKADMEETLLDMIRLSPHLDASEIILVSNVESDKVESLSEKAALKGLKFVRGDYFSELALLRANVKEARKVLILADTLESSAATEVDSKTVMTVLSIRAMSRNVYIVAEILDRKYESYLKQAMCDEILYSRDIARRMIANSSATSGMSHIMFELLSRDEGTSRLVTVTIPDAYVGRTYAEYRDAYRGTQDRVLLGILENSGSPALMKMESLREAQKTSDVSRLVNNLQKVKQLEVNRPIILPSDGYVIQRHALGIVIERAVA